MIKFVDVNLLILKYLKLNFLIKTLCFTLSYRNTKLPIISFFLVHSNKLTNIHQFRFWNSTHFKHFNSKLWSMQVKSFLIHQLPHQFTWMFNTCLFNFCSLAFASTSSLFERENSSITYLCVFLYKFQSWRIKIKFSKCIIVTYSKV